MEKEKVVALNNEILKIEEGKVIIESPEIAQAIINNQLELFIDEEQNSIFGNCLWSCSGKA